MAEAAAAEIEKMNVEGEKKEVVTALAGAFGVAPPIDTGCVREARRAREGKKKSARSRTRPRPPLTLPPPSLRPVAFPPRRPPSRC